MSEMAADEVSMPCRRCDTTTTHRRGPDSILRCVRCVIEDSIPGNDAPTPPASQPAVPMVEDERRPRSKAEIFAAIATALILGFLVYAFVAGRR
jgi:hypothetical protein